MKKLLLIGAIVSLTYFGASAQTTPVSTANDVVTVSTPGEEKPANADKKKKKSKKDKSCGDEKSKSCTSGEKKSCCSSKGHHSEAPAEKEAGK